MMGFFKELFDTGCPGKDQRALYYQQIAELERLKGLGAGFEYLGRKCVVVGHSTLIHTYPSLTEKPQLSYEYVDDGGVIQSGHWGYEVAIGVLKGTT